MYLKFAVRMVAQFEAQMNSVERLKNYAETVPQEDESPAEPLLDPTDPKQLPADWPAVGAIEGADVHMRYRDGPLVLRGVDFNVKGGEKIGIAGRTGCVPIVLLLFNPYSHLCHSFSLDSLRIM